MLRYIKIKNYALIEHVDISFSNGMTVITGETGSGKSILISAILFALGERFDAKLSTNTSSKKTIVEVCFDLGKHPNPYLKELFLSYDEVLDSEIIVRREFRSDGKSRSFVNDSPIKQAFLKKIAPYLISVYSQNEFLDLGSEAYQMRILDTYANNQTEIFAYQNHLTQYRKSSLEIEELEQQKKDAEDRKSYDEYLLNELIEADLKSDEQAELEVEQRSLDGVENIQSEMMRLENFLQKEDGLLSQFEIFQSGLAKIATHPQARVVSDRVQSMLLDLKDIEGDISRFSETLEVNPERLEEVNSRLGLIYDLQRKHNVNTIEALVEIRKKLQTSQSERIDVSERLQTLKDEWSDLAEKLNESAIRLYKSRIAVVEIVVAKLRNLLHLLGMPDVKLRIDVLPSDKYFSNGKDEVCVYFSANQGYDMQPLSAVISGGESSRVMLAIKYLLSEKQSLHTTLFDEIDVGVSGNIAHRMGEMMRTMSKKGQIIAVTHLPQVAVKGDYHYKVVKSKGGKEKVYSELVLLNENGRLVEVAKMLSNGEASDHAIEQAKTLIEYKTKATLLT